jgi:glyoxylase-like metal-dependent hydrolase (beta-lactamase superfamily II)
MTPPSLVIADRATIDLGNRILDLVAHPTAHTDCDLTIFDRRTATLWAADLVFMERCPSLDGRLRGWLDVIAGLCTIPAARVVPGHGPEMAAWPAALDAEARYLGLLLTEIRAVIARGGTIEQAVATVGLSERDRWLLFDDYNGRNVTAAFAELEWE